jgi:hypothetical protein
MLFWLVLGEAEAGVGSPKRNFSEKKQEID